MMHNIVVISTSQKVHVQDGNSVFSIVVCAYYITSLLLKGGHGFFIQRFMDVATLQGKWLFKAELIVVVCCMYKRVKLFWYFFGHFYNFRRGIFAVMQGVVCFFLEY